jgi:hypothetical protein
MLIYPHNKDLLFPICYPLHATRYTLHATRYTLHATRYTLFAIVSKNCLNATKIPDIRQKTHFMQENVPDTSIHIFTVFSKKRQNSLVLQYANDVYIYTEELS